ncbi:MAG: hypothetical protein ACRC0C_14530 [Gibbsiella quercinecans]
MVTVERGRLVIETELRF